MSYRRWFLITVFVVLPLLVFVPIVVGLYRFLSPEPLPPLLQNVSGGGGWQGACPPENETEARLQADQRLGISPEFDRRLSRQFPAGTPEGVLIETTTGQGFHSIGACKTDQSIKRAFFQNSRINAQLYWKLDEAKKVIWTKGFVSHRSL